MEISDDDRLRHLLLLGKNNKDTSGLMQRLIKDDIQNGKGVLLIDTFGTMIDNLLSFTPYKRAEDIIYINISDTDRPLGVNIFEFQEDSPDEDLQKIYITSSFIELMNKFNSEENRGYIDPSFDTILRNTILAVLNLSNVTLLEVIKFLEDTFYLKSVIPLLKDKLVQKYWIDQLQKYPELIENDSVRNVVAKLKKFTTDPLIRNIVGQSYNAVNFREIIDQGKIIFINIDKNSIGNNNTLFLGSILLNKIAASTFGRGEIDTSKPFFFYIDNIMDYYSNDFSMLLSEGRKSKIGYTLSSESVSNMDKNMKNSLFGNIGNLVAFGMDPQDADFLKHEFNPVFNNKDLSPKPNHVLVKQIVNGVFQKPLRVDLLKDEKIYEKIITIKDAVIQLSRLKYGRPKELVEAEILYRIK